MPEPERLLLARGPPMLEQSLYPRTMRTPPCPTPRRLAELVPDHTVRLLRGPLPDVAVTGITCDSRLVAPGDLFVATAGLRSDAHRFLADAAARGAAAAVVESNTDDAPALPLVPVSDSRAMLAELAAAWFADPAREVPLLGITGTLGKTSTLRHLETLLGAAGRRPGSIGSLGIRSCAAALGETGYTVPGPLRLHQALRELVDDGCNPVLMEATTHAMTQGRLHGVEFAAGVFTGLVAMEHIDYHHSFRAYVQAKLRFFDHLAPGAPLVYLADDLALGGIVRDRDVHAVPCGSAEDAAVRLTVHEVSADGARVRLHVGTGIRRLDGTEAAPFTATLRLPLPGTSAATNALLATGLAIVLGVEPGAIAAAWDGLEAPPRRAQVVRREPFVLLDDYGGHPDILSAAFQVVQMLPWKRLHIVSGYRGQREAALNGVAGEALGIWLRQTGCASLRLTRSAETTDELTRPTDEEVAAFQEGVRRTGVAFEAVDGLEEALRGALDEVRPGDLLLLLGSREMDGAAGRVQAWVDGGEFPALRG